MEGITRRDLLATAAVAAAGCSAALLAGCQAAPKKPAIITTGTVSLGPAADYPAGTASTKYLETYEIVVVNDSGTPIAIHPKCTHKGCMVPWKPQTHLFECPCHGSQFNMLGQPIKGPALRPLPAVACARLPDGTLSVDLTHLHSL